MTVAALDKPWVKRSLVVLAVLVALAPVFGWAATQVNYTEPLEHAAAETDASDEAVTQPSLMPDYGLPGLPTPIGTLVSGIVGTALVLGLGLLGGRVLASNDGRR